jgi:hypothetical protein
VYDGYGYQPIAKVIRVPKHSDVEIYNEIQTPFQIQLSLVTAVIFPYFPTIPHITNK